MRGDSKETNLSQLRWEGFVEGLISGQKKIMNNRIYFCQGNISFKSPGRIANNSTERNLTESILIFFSSIGSKPSMSMGKKLMKCYLP